VGAPTLRLGSGGWIEGLRRVPSAHHDARPAGLPIELLLLHNISLPPGRFGSGCIERFFCGELDAAAHPFLDLLAGMRVSAHFLIERDGRATQFVGCDRRAWHAGVSIFDGRRGCNDFSIGIELEGTDFTPFEPAQYETLARLTAVLRAKLPLRAVRGHCHVAPERKTDPGPLFDWHRLAAEADLPAHWLP
jgi:AmpD protein